MKFFRFERLVKLSPNIREIVRRHAKKLENEIKTSKNGRITKDIKNNFLVPLFSDIGNFLLMGDSEEVKMTSENGENLSYIIKRETQLLIDFITSPLNNLTFGLAAKYNLGPIISELKQCQKKAEKLIKKIYSSRKATIDSGKSEYENVILDAIIKHNNSGSEDPLSAQDIV